MSLGTVQKKTGPLAQTSSEVAMATSEQKNPRVVR